LLSLETGEKRRLTSPPEESRDDGPAFCPDGRTLVFIRWVATYTSDLYMLPLLDGHKTAGEPKRLTFDKAYSSSPVWTIDGHDIIFTSYYPPGGAYSLWRMAASGVGKPHRLPELGENARQATIPRQGHRLAYSRLLGWEDKHIWRAEIPGPHGTTSSPTKFISSSHEEFTAHYSPNGKKIVFGSGRSGSIEIWACDSDGSNAVQLTSLAAVSLNPRWSPDGMRVAFDSTAEGQPQIYAVDIEEVSPNG
jgi:Tol biopolymer transport system component